MHLIRTCLPIFSALALLCCYGPGAAQDVCSPYTIPELSEPAAGPQAEIPHTDSLLWMVTEPNAPPGHPPSYLFGTLHIDDVRLLTLPEAVEKAFFSSKVLVSELEFSLLGAGAQSIFQAMLNEREDPALKQLLSLEMYRRLEWITDQELPEVRLLLPRLKPWGVTLMLIEKLSKPAPERSTGIALDLYLQQQLAPQGKLQVAGLETLQEQITVFSGLSLEDQLHMLQEIICNLEQTRAESSELLNDYLAGDLRTLAQKGLTAPTYTANRGLFERFMERLIYQRNKIMAERLRPYLEQGGAFIAVGALHLPGQGGLVDLLLQAGLKVHAIPLSDRSSRPDPASNAVPNPEPRPQQHQATLSPAPLHPARLLQAALTRVP